MRTAWIALVLVACGPSTPAPASGPIGTSPSAAGEGSGAAPARPADPPSDPVRLAEGLTVRSYRPELTIDPEQPTFTGTMRIEATLAAPTTQLVLHGEKLVIKSATATPGGALRVSDPGKGRITLAADRAIPAGDLTIEIAYAGAIDDTDTEGIFRQQADGRWYVFSQFEAIAARRAFPSIDEPAVKVPWTVSLILPAGASAVGNTPIATDTKIGDTSHRIEFETTPPLPSYLVAFGIGPFEYVDAGKTATGVPIRIVTPHGRAKDAKVAAALTPKILRWLEGWFGMPFPYAKIDALAIPITVGFGAMENAGLITYRADILLIPPGAPKVFERRYAGYAAHELSHQWFGDLVTPAWWDDLWLNESFASWLPAKLFKDVFPAWTSPVDRVAGLGAALGADSLGTARRIRQPIATEDDILTAFDGISYGKGAAVLRMFESWAGEEKFQAGVRAYLTAHAHGNATAHDFLSAVSASTGADIDGTMSTFLDQAGAPLIHATIACEGDKARIKIEQSRYLPMGAARGATDPVWKLPVCVVYGAPGLAAKAPGARHEVCAVVTTPTATIEGDGCREGAWLFANAGGRGYYHAAVGDSIDALLAEGWKHLDSGERLAVAQDLLAGVSSGEADLATALDLLPALLADGSRHAIGLATGVIGGARRFLPPGDPAVARWVRKHWGPIAKRLGWKPKPHEAIDDVELRELVVPLVAELGGDAALIKQAVALAKDWRALPPGGSRGDLLGVAGRARPAMIDRWRADFVKETGRIDHVDLAVAIGRTDDRARLEASLALLLDPQVDVREAVFILNEATGDPVTQPWAEAWVIAHLDELIARFPAESAVRLVGSLTASCDADRIAPMRALADEKIAPLAGGARRIDQAFEGLAQCVAQRHAQEPALEAWRKRLK